MKGRSRTTDNEFVESLGIQGRDGALAIHIRRAVASMYSVLPESLCAQLKAGEIRKIARTWGSLDQVEFVMALEDSMGDVDVPVYAPNLERIPPLVTRQSFGIGRKSSANFGEWVMNCVKLLAVR